MIANFLKSQMFQHPAQSVISLSWTADLIIMWSILQFFSLIKSTMEEGIQTYAPIFGMQMPLATLKTLWRTHLFRTLLP